MDIQNIWKLVSGECSEPEKQKFLAEIARDENAQKTYAELKNAWALLSSSKKLSDDQVNRLYEQFKKQKREKTGPVRFPLNNVLKYAAVFAVGVFTALSAVLVHDGLKTPDSPPVVYATVIGDKDQVSRILLPDSSSVWVNSRSKITYNNNFGITNRDIALEGQAYFQAAKNKRLPLVVKTNGFEVKVLGTRFDVCAYPEDRNVNVVLESGKVEIGQVGSDSKHYQLAPGEMATCNRRNNEVTISKVETRLFTSWKDGLMIFQDDPMQVVISQLERRFNVQVVVKDPEVYNSVFTATINHEPLDKILKAMEFSASIKATVVRDDSTGTPQVTVILSKPKSNP